MSSLSSTVWERQSGRNDLATTPYIAAVTGFTTYGLILAAVVAFLAMSWQPNSIWPVLGVGLLIPLIGIMIALKSDLWPISLFGYTLVVVGLGVITGPTVALYKTNVVITALSATAGVTLVMSITGIVFPRLLLNWGGYLFGALVALLFVRIAQVFMAGMGMAESVWYMPWIEYGSAVLFSLYIVYDWNRALDLPRNLDNAVDSALAIFLDVINLFLSLLRIFGGSGSSKSSK